MSVPLAYGANDKIMPHTAIKHTVYVHCGPLTNSSPYPDILYSFSWIYDNTRGRMRYYPFCSCNACPPCSENQYDIVFTPEILFNQDAYHYYNESDKTILLQDGVIDYFPFQELQSLAQCNFSAQTTLPANSDLYTTNGSTFSHPFFPPFSLISAPALQWRGKNPAGYESGSPSTTIVAMGGLKHTYHIDKNIDLALINPIDKIIYNPSEVSVTTDNLAFPAGYTFKTILGRYPSEQQVITANTTANGGIYSDLRDVPVPVDATNPDVSWDDPATPDIDERYGYYKIENLGQITVEPCVRIFDAKFEVNQGGTLVFEDYPHVLNPARFTVTGNGGAVAKNYVNTQYLQNTVVTQPQLIPYIATNKIYAGEDVDPNANTIAPYILEPGSHVDFLAGNTIYLRDGFRAKAGSSFHANCHYVSSPVCNIVSRMANNQQSIQPGNETVNQSLIITPNPASNQVKIVCQGISQGILQITDMTNRMVLQKELNTQSNVDVSALPTGLYIVNASNKAGQHYNSKLIIQ